MPPKSSEMVTKTSHVFFGYSLKLKVRLHCLGEIFVQQVVQHIHSKLKGQSKSVTSPQHVKLSFKIPGTRLHVVCILPVFPSRFLQYTAVFGEFCGQFM